MKNICQIRTTSRRIGGTRSSEKRTGGKIIHGRCEVDNHADTCVAGSNCTILQYTGKVCDVSPYRDDYESIKNVPIVNAATAWQSTLTGQFYILVINECIWMGDNMDHTLINPNQLRHFGTKVQDNLTLEEPLSIITEDKEFLFFFWIHSSLLKQN